MSGGGRPQRGRKLADRRVRVERPHAPYFRYTGPGQLVAKAAASAPTTPGGRVLARARSFLFGRPLAMEEEATERLPKKQALAIFSSDAISSSAYATEEILRVLVLAGAAAILVSIEIAIAISILLAVVALSYRQLCRAYPNGGGAYAVAKENIGPLASLVAAAALLIDYVMTVAVSTASAIAQTYSVFPGLFNIRVEVAVVSITLITIANLRGLRESGNIFAVPTYLFLGLALLMVGIGVLRIATGGAYDVAQPDAAPFETQTFGLFLLLKAFASGSVALTGTEAIANGVPAFKPPEVEERGQHPRGHGRPPGRPLHRHHGRRRRLRDPADEGGRTDRRRPRRDRRVRGRIRRSSTPSRRATALILFLAANTSFNAFPRLAALLAEDGYMPRQFSFRGDRLAFSWGIVLLAAIAAGLLALFGGDTHALIPLYSVGVFVCFTLSQAGHGQALVPGALIGLGLAGRRSTRSARS